MAAGEEEWNFGRTTKLTDEVKGEIYRLKDDGESVSEIARVLEISRPTVYKALGEQKTGTEA